MGAFRSRERGTIRSGLVVLMACHLAAAGAAEAQQPARAGPDRVAIGMWGGLNIPVSDLSDRHSGLGPGAKAGGLVVGGELVVGLWSGVAVWVGWSRSGFSCGECGDPPHIDVDTGSAGWDAGVELRSGGDHRVVPWLRVGMLRHRYEVEGGPRDGQADSGFGVAAGTGLEIHLRGALSVAPAVRYHRYHTELPSFLLGDIVISSSSGTVSWFEVDIGLRFRLTGGD